MINLKTQVKGVAYRLLLNPEVRKLAEKLPFLRGVQGGLHRTHPFDVAYGVDTSGILPSHLIETRGLSASLISPYIGSQPSVTRRALATLRDIEDYSFVDIGCGKGRVVIVGSEFPFKEIVGLELSPELVKIAQSNLDKIQRRFPGRPPIRIIEGNALEHLVLSGKVVFYIYHPFGREMMSELVQKIQSALTSTLEHVFIVYHNPVWGSLLDTSPALCRWFADTISYDAADLGIGEDTCDGLAIWQSLRGARPRAYPGADRGIIIVKENWKAEIAP